MITGVYCDGPEQRNLEPCVLDGLSLELTASQIQALTNMMEMAVSANTPTVVPLFLSAETGTGKTEVALIAAMLLMKKMSFNLKQLHGLYIAPTRRLATQVEERFKIMAKKHLPGLRMFALSGQDINKTDLVREAFSAFTSNDRLLLSTNPQFLASLATKNAGYYGIQSRSAHFQLAAALAEANLIIVDEPHFYTGKSLIRFLTLLLSILEYKAAATVFHPTILLFMSATMSPHEIQLLLDYLTAKCGLDRVPLHKSPLVERWLHLGDSHRGAKWTLLQQVSDEEELAKQVINVIQSSMHLSVVYRDSIVRLVQLQETLTKLGISTVLLHSQMPALLQEKELGRLHSGQARVVLATSMAEVGVEFERYGITGVDRMVSINTQSIGKLIQRWGRLARHPGINGVLYVFDTPDVRYSVCQQLVNNYEDFDQAKASYPSLIEATERFQQEFLSIYRSPAADQSFAMYVRKAIAGVTGEVPAIYLGTAEQVMARDGEGSFTIPLSKLSAGAMALNCEYWAEFSHDNGEFIYRIHAGRLHSNPQSLLNGEFSIRKIHATLRRSNLPEWLLQLGVSQANLCQAEVSLRMPIVSYVRKFISPAIRLHFSRSRISVGPSFTFTNTYADLLERFAPADIDVDLIALREKDANVVWVYEPALKSTQQSVPIGAVEFIWTEVLGGDNCENTACLH